MSIASASFGGRDDLAERTMCSLHQARRGNDMAVMDLRGGVENRSGDGRHEWCAGLTRIGS